MPTPAVPIPTGPAVPDSSLPEPTFDAQWEAYNEWVTDEHAPGANALAEVTYDNAVEALAAAAAADSDRVQAELAAAAAAAAAASALNAPGTNATSTTSLLIGAGSKTLTIQTGKAFSVGQTVVLASAANVANQMIGQITAHDNSTGSLTVNVNATGGSGTMADWIVSLSALNAATSVTWTGKQTFKGYGDTVYPIADGAAFAIDPENGAVQTVTLGASRTPVLANFSSGQTVVLGINDGSSYAITWTSIAPIWVRPGGTGSAPVLHPTGFTWVLIWKVGSSVYAAEIGKP